MIFIFTGYVSRYHYRLVVGENGELRTNTFQARNLKTTVVDLVCNAFDRPNERRVFVRNTQ